MSRAGEILAEIRRTLDLERQALEAAAGRVDARMVEAVERILACRGRLVVTGMGKAGLVGRKIAATLASTGTPASYLHPAEALHGDLGVVTGDDLVLVLSHSGETDEVLRLLPHVKALGAGVLAMTGNPGSSLARHADVVIDVAVKREADPFDLVPTASTTVMLAVGDALACALLRLRGFGPEQFALVHPGGSLGRRLLLRVADLMHQGDRVPIVGHRVPLRDAIPVMSSRSLGVLFVVDDDGRLRGVFTDGDLRRLLQRNANPLDHAMEDVMTRTARSIAADALAVEALRRMEDHAILVLPVLDADEHPIGALHMHDLVRAGLVPVGGTGSGRE